MSSETGDSCRNLLQDSHKQGNMSLTQSIDYSMQTEDKSIGLPPQSLDDSVNDLFNQYVNMDRPNMDGNKEKSLAPSLDIVFVQGTPSSGPGYVPVTGSPNGNDPTPQPWRKGLWCLHDTALSATERHAHLDKTVQPSAVSGGFDVSTSPRSPKKSGPLSPSASTPPTTLNKKAAKSGAGTSKTIHRRDSNERRNLLRKYNSSPTLMRTANLGKQEMTFQTLRAPKSQNFAFQQPEKWASFPSPSTETQMRYGGMSHLAASCHNIPNDGDVGDSAEFPVARFESSMLHQSQTVSMPLQSTNIIGQHDQFDTASGAFNDNNHLNTEDLYQTPCTTEQQSFSSEQQSFSSWNSDFTNNMPTIPHAESHTQETQPWWSSIPTRFSQPYSPSYEPMIMAPIPHRIDTSLANSTNLAQGDIGTHFNSASDLCSSAAQFFPGQASSPTDMAVGTPYSSLPTSQSFSLDSLIRGSSQRQASPPPSRSPSVSPTVVTLPRRSSTTNAISSGPITRASNPKDQRRTHNRKHSTTGNTPRTPRASASSKSLGGKPSNGALNVSFVNFTPNDSQKILTGVAPSGSSKTKARREQEAKDKRRKLSEAALTAIRRAGGDVDDLQSVFC